MPKKMILKVIIIISMLCFSKAYALENNVFNFKNQIYTYESSDSLSKKVLNSEVKFSKPQSIDESQLSTGNKWNWVKFRIENPSKQVEKKYLVIQNGLIENLSYYIKNDISRKVIVSFHTGIAHPFSQRLIQNRQFTFPIVLSPNSSYTIYLRGHLNTGTLMMPLSLFSEAEYQDYLLVHNGLSIFTVAIWFFSILIGLVLYFIFKERLYLFYSVYVILLMLFWASYEALSYQYLWPNNPFLANNSRNSYLLASVFFAAFMLSILGQSGNKLSFYKKIIKYLSWLFVPLTVLISITSKYYFNWCGKLVVLADLCLILVILIVVISLVKKIKEKNEYSFLAAISASPMIFYVLVQFLSYYKIINISRTGFFMQYGFGFCSIFEVLFLLNLLVFRIKRIIVNNVLSEEKVSEFSTLISDYKKGVLIEKEKTSYQSSQNTLEELKEIMKNINYQIIENQIFKNQGLTIVKLAEQLNYSPHIISECINRIEESNYNDFINKFRIEVAEKMLLSSDFKNYTIEGIGEEVGFASKATFYSSFKKFTGTTPKQYLVKVE